MAERSQYKNSNNRILGNFFVRYRLAEGLTAKGKRWRLHFTLEAQLYSFRFCNFQDYGGSASLLFSGQLIN